MLKVTCEEIWEETISSPCSEDKLLKDSAFIPPSVNIHELQLLFFVPGKAMSVQAFVHSFMSSLIDSFIYPYFFFLILHCLPKHGIQNTIHIMLTQANVLTVYL